MYMYMNIIPPTYIPMIRTFTCGVCANGVGIIVHSGTLSPLPVVRRVYSNSLTKAHVRFVSPTHSPHHHPTTHNAQRRRRRRRRGRNLARRCRIRIFSTPSFSTTTPATFGRTQRRVERRVVNTRGAHRARIVNWSSGLDGEPPSAKGSGGGDTRRPRGERELRGAERERKRETEGLFVSVWCRAFVCNMDTYYWTMSPSITST